MGLGGTENVIINLCKYLKDDYKIYVCSANGVNVSKLNEYGVDFIEIPDICSCSILELLKIKIKLKKFIILNSIDIVHTHHRKAAFLISIMYLKNVKLIHTMHNIFHDKILTTRYMLKKFLVVACGKNVYDSIKLIYKLKNIYLIENGIDNSLKEIEFPFFINQKKQGKFIFGFVGRLCEQKGIDKLLESFVVTMTDKMVLVIYGDGTEYIDLVKKYCDKYDNIYYFGYTNNSLEVISNFDCLILPSRWEGLALTIIEAISVKTFVACSDISENKEIIKNNYNGITFSLNETINFPYIMECAINKKEIVENAYELYNKNYKIENFVKKYRSIYNE